MYTWPHPTPSSQWSVFTLTLCSSYLCEDVAVLAVELFSTHDQQCLFFKVDMQHLNLLLQGRFPELGAVLMSDIPNLCDRESHRTQFFHVMFPFFCPLFLSSVFISVLIVFKLFRAVYTFFCFEETKYAHFAWADMRVHPRPGSTPQMWECTPDLRVLVHLRPGSTSTPQT